MIAGRALAPAKVMIIPDRSGHPIPSMEPEDLEAQRCASGEAGEIIVSGPHVITRCLPSDLDTTQKIKAGDTIWHRTGDAGLIDGEGRLALLGRCAHRMASRVRDWLYPLQIEGLAEDVLGSREAIAAFPLPNGGCCIALAGIVDDEKRERLRRILAMAGLSPLILDGLGALPRDRRHHSKVDVGILRKRVTQQIKKRTLLMDSRDLSYQRHRYRADAE